MCLKPFWEIYQGSADFFQTECPVALFTIEMGVHVRYRTVIFAFAHLEFDGTGTVVNRMHQMILFEYFQSPEYAGLVHSLQLGFQISQRHGPRCIHQCVQDQYPDGSRPDSLLLQPFYALPVIHACTAAGLFFLADHAAEFLAEFVEFLQHFLADIVII